MARRLVFIFHISCAYAVLHNTSSIKTHNKTMSEKGIEECEWSCRNGIETENCECSKEQNRIDEKEEDMDNTAEYAVNQEEKMAKKKPGEYCTVSEQCADVGPAQYYCIANVCQIPPECPPGHASIGPECFPFAVTGGECVHPIQCLSGSVCINGICRGPCDENQIFIDDNCVDYEGGGCVARPCVKHKCPRAFPSCNYVPQRDEYLCCERQIRSSVQCADSSSVPQISQVSNEVVNCMVEPCGPGFTCQFSNHGRGSYICCSIPTNNKRRNDRARKRKMKNTNNSFFI